MALDPFANIESRINSSAVRMLANVVADFGGGLTVPGAFDDKPLEDYEVQVTTPRFVCESADVVTVADDALVTIKSQQYRVVRGDVDAGLVTMFLHEA